MADDGEPPTCFVLPCLQEMLHAEQKELENFLTHIYRAIASAAPLKDKVT